MTYALGSSGSHEIRAENVEDHHRLLQASNATDTLISVSQAMQRRVGEGTVHYQVLHGLPSQDYEALRFLPALPNH